MGFIFPITGLSIFVISFFACTDPEPFDHDVDAAFEELDRTGAGVELGAAHAKKGIMAKNTEEAEIELERTPNVDPEKANGINAKD